MPKTLLLITGASGFVGSHAVKFALNSPNYDCVLATDIKEINYQWSESLKEFVFLKADLTNSRDIQQIADFIKNRNDLHRLVVWHIGGVFNYSAPRELLYRVNVSGTRALLEALWELNGIVESDGRFFCRMQRFVFWSGGIVYGNFNHPKGILPAEENYPVNPQNDYGWSKKEAEDWILFYHQRSRFPVTIMRMAAIYGVHSRYGMGSAIALNADGRLAPLLVGDPRNHVALIHVEDVIRVADFLSWAPEADGEIYNVVDDSVCTLKEISIFLGQELNNKPFKFFSLPSWVMKTLIKLVNRKAKELGGLPVIDPELGNLVLINSWMSNRKLKTLAEKHNRPDLLKYPFSRLGLAETISGYKKEKQQ
jgi:dihydroflavonol-4-reductase